MGSLPGETRTHAWGVSGDGNTVVGHAEHGKFGNFEGQAFRWTTTNGMQGLGYGKAGDFFSRANGVSRDGKAIVGITGPAFMDAFIWTEAGGMKILPKLPNPAFYDTYAQAVNADGTVVVGSSPSASGASHAVRWSAGQVHDLTNAAFPSHSKAYAVSDDGSVIGGGWGDWGWIWTSGTGMTKAVDYLSLHGVVVPSDYFLGTVYAISGDGLTFGGVAYNLTNQTYEGYVATIPAPGATAILLVGGSFFVGSRCRRGS